MSSSLQQSPDFGNGKSNGGEEFSPVALPVPPTGPYSAVLDYLDRFGWRSIDFIFGQKFTKEQGWEQLRLCPEELRQRFNGAPKNVGVLLGEPSNGLGDVDCDCPQAVTLAPFFLPDAMQTAAFGRQSTAIAHYLYTVIGEARMEQFDDPEAKALGPNVKARLLEFRFTGVQTMFPPSVHPSGERVTWDRYRDPVAVEASTLLPQIRKLAAAAMALAGGLLRGGWTQEAAERFVEAVAAAAGDEEASKRRDCVRDTADKLARGREVTGWQTLTEHIGERVLRKAKDWLGIRDSTLTTAMTRDPERFVSFVSAPSPPAEDWPKPASLPDGLPPVELFEPKLLPEAFRPWIEDITERMQCPPDFPAVAAMIAEAAVVGRRVGIRPKRRDNWLVVPNLWGGVVGRPGVLKTPAIQEPLRPVWRLEFDAGRAYEEELKEWKADLLIAKERERLTSGKIREALKKGQDAKALAQHLLASEDSQPIRRRYVVNDSTVEKLGELLNENPNGLLVFRDELTGLLRTLDREGHEGDRAFYLEAWNGTGRFVYDRIGRGTVEIEAACVSILGGIQPGPLAHYLRAALNGGVGDDGLIQRFQLLVWPDVSKEWKDVDRWPDNEAKQRAYSVFSRLDHLTAPDIDATCDEDLGGIPYLRFAPEAQELFTEWRSALEHRLRRGEDPPPIEAHLSKYRSLVPSVALLIHLADGHGNPVSVEALERACAWAEYLESHARRVYSRGLGADCVAARALAARILKGDLPRDFALRDVYRPQWSDLTTRDEAMKAVNMLLDLDWLRAVKEETGGRPGQHFLVNPRLWEDGHEVA